MVNWTPQLGYILRLPERNGTNTFSFSSSLTNRNLISPEQLQNIQEQSLILQKELAQSNQEIIESNPFPGLLFISLTICYLLTISLLDWYIAYKFHRPWLTWITFPCWIILFTLLFYFLGTWLNAEELFPSLKNLIDL